ncbi:MAG: filamentous hemagglutinin N-terminal domain-containing protein [Phycisphaerae bacterium]|nr:filamentous hemagglutinin N-terminal domain-containing protein [Phycisphaerae bacterium]
MKIISKILKRRYLSRSLIYFLTCGMVVNTSLPLAIGLEAVDVTGSTGVVGTTWGDHTIINTDHGAIINWSNFNTNSTQSIRFNQYLGGELSSVSAVLNRVSSGAIPTQFNGALDANGRVFVVNPAGVIFGAGSVVNVSQLVACGLNMSDDAFGAVLADSSNRMAFEGGQGEVRNLGSISADSVYLIGKKVTNLGSIKAPDGLVVMAAGDNVYLGQDGSNVVVELGVESLDPGADVQSRGLLSASNGKIVLAAGDTFSGAVSNVGVLAASAGEVTVDAGRVENSGLITADAADGDGGNINVTAAEEIVLQPDSRTTANAGLNGSAGSVILKSGGTTVVSQDAVVEARGGSESGDGGFVEVSGEHFVLAGDIDISAENGTPGTLFIDPLDVTIAGGANAGAVDTVYENDIQDQSQAGTNVLVEAQNSITVENIPDDEITGGAGDISLRTTNPGSSIIFVDKDDAITTTMGDIVIQAGGGNGGGDNPDVGTGAGVLEDGPELLIKNLQRSWQREGKRRYQTEEEPAEAPTEQPALLASVAPIGEEVELEYSGCSALMKWAAVELGVDETKMDIWMTNSVASARGIQPCDTCARLKEAATVLRDNRGLRVAALSRVISEFTSSAVPPSEEQDASIIAAISNNDDANSHYAMAGEYLDYLTAYVGTLSSEMDFSIAESVIFAADRYVAPLAERNSDNVGLTAFLVARLTALSES